jgi:phosphoglycerate dehydrogenase-like enzyme
MKILVTAGWDIAPTDDPDLIIWEGSDITPKIPLDVLMFHGLGLEGIVAGDEEYTEEIMQMLPDLKVIARCGNGWDNIDLDAAKKLGIRVTRVEGAYKEAVADSTLSMILALARRTISLDRSMHGGEWARERYPGVAMRETTVGIIGLGPIGEEVRQRLVPFGGKIMIHRPFSDGPDSWTLETLLELSDFVTLHVKLTPETYHMIGERELAFMKPGSYLINTSRGGLIDTNALLMALKARKLGGAGLDVFEQEPLPHDHPLRYYENVILAPHNAYYSPQERKSVVHRAIREAKQWVIESKSSGIE